MIIETQQDVTTAVLAEMHRTPDPRTKQILESLVRHLHGFVRDVKLTEREFDQAVEAPRRLMTSSVVQPLAEQWAECVRVRVAAAVVASRS